MTIPVIERGPIDDEQHFREFSIDVPTYGGETPDRIDPPDAYFERKMRHGTEFPFPDAAGNVAGAIEMWGFEDDVTGEDLTFPSKIIRVTEGQLFHGVLKARHGPHTIHWHGIEPTSWNDGVGKLSFEVENEYTYQWLAAEAGTYFYHCHRNTVLHFEYGMYGPLIIDPPNGPGWVRRKDEQVQYDVERIWAADEMDLRWHELDKDAGIGGFPFDNEDPGLNVFEPTLFAITGVFHPWTRTSSQIIATASVGQTILLRILAAGYTYQTWRLGLPAEVIAMDGRTLGRTSPHAYSPYSQPFMLPANTPFTLTSARRWDLLVKPTTSGRFPVSVVMHDMNSSKPAELGRCETFIDVDFAGGEQPADADTLTATAVFRDSIGLLTIRANSSIRRRPLPTLTAVGFGQLRGGSLIVRNVSPAPATVTIESSAGGRITVPVAQR